MGRVLARVRDRHLMRSGGALDGQAVDHLRARPALRRREHDERPARPARLAARTGGVLDRRDLREREVERLGHEPMHRRRLVAFDEVGDVPVAAQQTFELLPRNPGQDGRVGDLVAVQMQDRQHRAVVRRVQELVAVPAGRGRARLRLAVADDARDHQIRVVEHGSEGVTEAVAELAALVDGPRGLRRDMARDPARERELGEQSLEAGFVLRHVRIHLGVCALEVRVRDERRPAVARSGDVEHVDVALADDPIEVDVDEVLARRRPPVAEQPRLDVRRRERHLEQRVVVQIDLPDRQVVGRPPVGIHFRQEVGGDLAAHVTPFARARAWRAIIRFSFVGMTRTEQAPSGALIRSASRSLRSGSSRTPRCARPSQIAQRTGAACSPIPPVKTRVSRPPSSAASPPISLRTRRQNRIDGLGGARVRRAARQQLPHVAARLRDAEQTGFPGHDPLQGGRVETPLPGEKDQHARIEVAASRAHDHAPRRRKAHGRVDGTTVAHGGQAGAVSEMRDDAAPERGGAHRRDDVLVRQAVIPEAADSIVPELAREREALGDLRHAAVERRVEARDVPGAGRLGEGGLDRRQLGRHVQRREPRQRAQFGQERGVNRLRRGVRRSAEHDAMADRGRCGRLESPKGLPGGRDRHPDVGDRAALVLQQAAVRSPQPEPAVVPAQILGRAHGHRGLSAREVVQRELERRRPAVEREDAHRASVPQMRVYARCVRSRMAAASEDASIGLAMCRWKPACSARRRSSSRANDVTATAGTRAARGLSSARIRRMRL